MSASFPLLVSASSLVVVYITYLILSFGSQKLRAYNVASRHSCAPIPYVSSWDPILGIDTFIAIRKADFAGYRSKAYQTLHSQYGHTFLMKSLETQLQTSSAENIQAICTSKFNDFGVGPMRGTIGLPFLGRGIFTEDGEFWKYSRALVRPTFARAEIADLENFEHHVARFLALIPREGKSFNVLPLSKKLVSL